MKKFNLLLLFISLAYVLSAQTYSGVVVEKDGKKAIAGVNVSLVTSKGLLVAWGYSDDKGLYKVALPQGKTADKIHFSLSTLNTPLVRFLSFVLYNISNSFPADSPKHSNSIL